MSILQMRILTPCQHGSCRQRYLHAQEMVRDAECWAQTCWILLSSWRRFPGDLCALKWGNTGLWLRKVQWLSQNFRATWWQRWDENPGSETPRKKCFSYNNALLYAQRHIHPSRPAHGPPPRAHPEDPSRTRHHYFCSWSPGYGPLSGE